MENEIFNTLKSILIEKFDIDKNKITTTSDLVNDLGIDSFGAIELKYELENQFKLKIDNSDIASIITVKDIIKYIMARKKR